MRDGQKGTETGSFAELSKNVDFHQMLEGIRQGYQRRLTEIYLIQKGKRSITEEYRCAECLNCDCQECRGTGVIISIVEDRYTVWDCSCKERSERIEEELRAQREMKARIRSARLRPEFINKTFDDFKALPQKEKAKMAGIDYVKNFKEVYKPGGIGITFIGEPGRGKSLLSHIIAQEIVKQGFSVLRVGAKELLFQIKATFDEKSDSKSAEILDLLKNVDLLVLDNLNAKRFSLYDIDTIFEVLNYRIEERLPTIINTIEGKDWMKKNLSAEIVSRIIGRNGEPVVIGGVDMRLKQAREITRLREESIANLLHKGEKK